eukprot:8945813-Ditylum_brightwellii.AAC.1
MSEEKGRKSTLSSAEDRYSKNLVYSSPSPFETAKAAAVSKHKAEEIIKKTEEANPKESSFGLEKQSKQQKMQSMKQSKLFYLTFHAIILRVVSQIMT